MKTTLTVMLLTAVAATSGAQTVIVHETQAKAAVEQQLQVLLDQTSASGIHLSFELNAVTGAPYAGETVTESGQVLADGNRIVRRTAVRVYRDSAGRTRRETMDADGHVTSIVISDPAAGTSYVLDPSTNTARRTQIAMSFVSSGGAGGRGGRGGQGASGVAVYVSPDARRETEAKAIREGELKTHVTSGQSVVTSVGPITWVSEGAGSASSSSKEDLGQQTIEGVVARGSRTTTVIPVGAIGNEQPITVVSEEWLSPELKVLVMTTHIDPRAGETTYRLTNISRREPVPQLFEVPAGDSVK